MRKYSLSALIACLLLCAVMPAYTQPLFWTPGSYGTTSVTVTVLSGTTGNTGSWEVPMMGAPFVWAQEILAIGSTIKIVGIYYRTYTCTVGSPYPNLVATIDDNLTGSNMFLSTGVYSSDYAAGTDHDSGAPPYSASNSWQYTVAPGINSVLNVSATIVAQVADDGTAGVSITED